MSTRILRTPDPEFAIWTVQARSQLRVVDDLVPLLLLEDWAAGRLDTLAFYLKERP